MASHIRHHSSHSGRESPAWGALQNNCSAPGQSPGQSPRRACSCFCSGRAAVIVGSSILVPGEARGSGPGHTRPGLPQGRLNVLGDCLMHADRFHGPPLIIQRIGRTTETRLLSSPARQKWKTGRTVAWSGQDRGRACPGRRQMPRAWQGGMPSGVTFRGGLAADHIS